MATQAKAQAKKAANNNKASHKKRGAYNFSAAGATITAASNSAKTQARKNTAAAKRISEKAANTAKSNINLGLASIAKSTSNASRQTANTVSDSFDRSANVLKGAYANAATNAKQMQQKITTFSKEVTNNLTQTANRAAQNANTSFEISRQNAEAIAQAYQTTSEAAKRTTAEFFSYINEIFADNVEAARQALECRNVSELFELQSRVLRSNLENAMGEAMRISEIAIQSATEALEPINESVSRNSKKISELVS